VTKGVSPESLGDDGKPDLPRRPRAIPELVTLPFGDEGWLLVGADRDVIIGGRTARVLPRVLSRLDGGMTLAELEAALPDVGVRKLHAVLRLLEAEGLLEDGGPEGLDGAGSEDVGSFLGRHIGLAAQIRNREGGLARLAAASVRVLGSPGAARMMAAQLNASGVSRVSVGADAHLRQTDDLTLTVSVEAGADGPRMSEAVLRAGGRCYLVRIGAGEAHVGPLITPGLTMCLACLGRVHPHPPGTPRDEEVEFWVGMASAQVVLTLAGIEAWVPYRQFRAFVVGPDRQLRGHTRVAAPTLGCASCGFASVRPAAHKEVAWHYHCTVVPSLSTARRARAASPRATDTAVGQPVPLPPPPVDPVGEIGRQPALEGKAVVTLRDVATLLAQMDPDRSRSLTLWVGATQVEGLSPHVYRYDAVDHVLRPVPGVAEEQVRRALAAAPPSAPACTLVATGHLDEYGRRFQESGYHALFLESGAALAQARLATRGLGLSACEYRDFRDVELAQSIGLAGRWPSPLPAFALGIRAGRERPDWQLQSTGGEGGRCGLHEASPAVEATEWQVDRLLPRLIDAALAPPPPPPDRAPAGDLFLPDCAASGPDSWSGRPLETLRALMNAAWRSSPRRPGEREGVSWLRPLLILRRAVEGLGAGVYELDQPANRLERRPRPGPEAIGRARQGGEGRFAAHIVFVGSLDACLTERSVRGYREIYQDAGRASMSTTLEARRHGLAARISIDVDQSQLANVLGFDGFRESPLSAVAIDLGANLVSARPLSGP
jgi:hypothetical protein